MIVPQTVTVVRLVSAASLHHFIDPIECSQYYTSMKPLVSTQVLKDVDEKAMNEYMIPSLLLMEHAGVKGYHRMVELSGRLADPSASLVVVAGSGNNGGDALVMAREAYLSGRRRIQILLLGTHLSQASVVHRQIIENLKLESHQVSCEDGVLDSRTREILEHADQIIDGILGTGLHSKVTDATACLFHAVNAQRERGAQVVSLDVPSGYSDQLSATMAHIEADITLTFGIEKYGAYIPSFRSAWGVISVVNPSFPPSLLERVSPEAYRATFLDVRLPSFTAQEYKNTRGHVALFGGSEKYSGAVQLTGTSAFSSGAGLVSVFTDEKVAEVLRTDRPSLIVHTVQEHLPVKGDALNDYDAVVCGPGWGRERGRERQVQEILTASVPVVLDADALSAFALLVSEKRVSTVSLPPLVLTPHPGELRQMLEMLSMPLWAQDSGPAGTPEAFVGALKSIARALKVVLVYKSHVVWIIDGRNEESVPVVVEGRNNALGVAGSGDVLSGIIGALAAGGLDAGDAAVSGVLLHQKAGELAREEHRWFDSQILTDYVAAAYALAEEGAHR